MKVGWNIEKTRRRMSEEECAEFDEELPGDFEAGIAAGFGSLTSRGKRMELVEQMLREDAKGSEERSGLQGGVCGKGVAHDGWQRRPKNSSYVWRERTAPCFQ